MISWVLLGLFTSTALAQPTPAPTPGCKNGTQPCVFAPGKMQCCTPGESCVKGIGCRCEGSACWGVTVNPTPAPTPCAKGTKLCEYAPGKSQCCTPGESCVKDIGCRCEGKCDKTPTPGVFGNPPEFCRIGTLLEGPPLNDTLQVTIVTYNLQGWAQQPQNCAKQAEVLRGFSPDFIATQEDMYGWEMQKYLGEGSWCFVGETRDGRSCTPSCPVTVPPSKNGGDGEHTFIYYRCKHWQVLQTNTVYMGNFADDGYPRIYTNGLFQHLETKKQLWITSTHLPKKKAVPGQQVCIQDLVPMGDEWRGNSILLGDWNIIEETTPSDLYKPLKANRFWFDSFDACPKCRLCHHGYDKHMATFGGAGLFCDDSHPEISDHFPVVGVYTI